MESRRILIVGAWVMAAGIALGAFGAHGLRDMLAESGRAGTWETAVLYHLVHGLALWGLGVWTAQQPGLPGARAVAILWLIGIGVFSGSLYLLGLGAPRWIGILTPFGGIAFLMGWLWIGLGALGRAR